MKPLYSLGWDIEFISTRCQQSTNTCQPFDCDPNSRVLAQNKISKIRVGVKIKIKESKVDNNNYSFVYINSIQKIDKAIEKKS